MGAELLNQTVDILCAAEAADDVSRKLTKWVGADVHIQIMRDEDTGSMAILYVEDQEIYRCSHDDPVSAVDDLTRWAWRTLIIATSMWLLDWGTPAEA
jgi:hypothetical protein